MNKIGYHVHPKMAYQRDWSAEERRYFWDHVQKAQSGGLLFLDDIDSARQAKRLLPDCKVVFRRWFANEGGLMYDIPPRRFYDDHAKYGDGGIIINVLNEPSGYVTNPNDPNSRNHLKHLAHWVAEVCDLFGKAGISCAPPAFGEGHPDVDRLSELDEMWDALSRWVHMHYYNLHEYGTHRGMLYKVGGKFDVFPWRVGRDLTFVIPYLTKHGYKIAPRLVTEGGIDSAHDGTAHRGWNTKFSEDEYADELFKALGTVYAGEHYAAYYLYCWGNTGREFTESDWKTHDIAKAYRLHQRIVERAESLRNGTSAPIPVPAPTPAPIPAPTPLPTPAPVPLPDDTADILEQLSLLSARMSLMEQSLIQCAIAADGAAGRADAAQQAVQGVREIVNRYADAEQRNAASLGEASK